MSLDTLRGALEAVTTWPDTPQVHFTGGEPFLHFALLLDGVRMASDLGIPRYLETNASWCVDAEQAVERFQALKEAGLQAALISCSPFHAESIPLVRTVKALRAAEEVFGPQGVTLYLPEFLELVQLFGMERTVPLSQYVERFGLDGAQSVLWQGYGIISGGRSGYELGHLTPRYPVESFAQADCVMDILYAHHSHLDPYGNYISGFCGGLTIGDWHDLPHLLADFRAGRYPPLVEVLVKQGPYGLCRLAEREFGYSLLAEGYTGKCHLCVDVRRHLVERSDFAELRPPGFYANF